MSKTELNILLTRPIQKSQSLARELTPLAQHIEIQPLFTYEENSDNPTLSQALKLAPEHIIFVSEAAARFALEQCPLSSWPKTSHYYAVGPATADALSPLNQTILMGERFDSEGLLALQQLQNIENQQVLIIRGNGGRELLAQTLRQRQAIVAYNEVYRRQWQSFNVEQLIEKWRKLKINCMVVTSEALLDKAVELITKADEDFKQQLQWIVASERIAEKAKHYQLQKVVNAGGASNQLIFQALKNL
ncbi:uroporphyrinogen-III synthase [Thalassotalea sp. PS06]|uniref:uroporphyrinogen-III synthase n=1 Tax=Thalassotalea sp. PS06 TaxID=2594005 RepID=UPI001163517B|nr:uroporphyrinogen-III synthase [Thalassotalea sp. PS06]QDP02582.1 uroporphyrinogen-III synthase [Thalassotalea sp. PS06]